MNKLEIGLLVVYMFGVMFYFYALVNSQLFKSKKRNFRK